MQLVCVCVCVFLFVFFLGGGGEITQKSRTELRCLVPSLLGINPTGFHEFFTKYLTLQLSREPSRDATSLSPAIPPENFQVNCMISLFGRELGKSVSHFHMVLYKTGKSN